MNPLALLALAVAALALFWPSCRHRRLIGPLTHRNGRITARCEDCGDYTLGWEFDPKGQAHDPARAV